VRFTSSAARRKPPHSATATNERKQLNSIRGRLISVYDQFHIIKYRFWDQCRRLFSSDQRAFQNDGERTCSCSTAGCSCRSGLRAVVATALAPAALPVRPRGQAGGGLASNAFQLGAICRSPSSADGTLAFPPQNAGRAIGRGRKRPAQSPFQPYHPSGAADHTPFLVKTRQDKLVLHRRGAARSQVPEHKRQLLGRTSPARLRTGRT